jgi:hypothetical protein
MERRFRRGVMGVMGWEMGGSGFIGRAERLVTCQLRWAG